MWADFSRLERDRRHTEKKKTWKEMALLWLSFLLSCARWVCTFWNRRARFVLLGGYGSWSWTLFLNHRRSVESEWRGSPYQHITMHPCEDERGRRQRLPALEGHWGRPVPDFIRKSILLFFGAVGYFIKKPFNSILKEEKGKKWSKRMCFSVIDVQSF